MTTTYENETKYANQTSITYNEVGVTYNALTYNYNGKVLPQWSSDARNSSSYSKESRNTASYSNEARS